MKNECKMEKDYISIMLKDLVETRRYLILIIPGPVVILPGNLYLCPYEDPQRQPAAPRFLREEPGGTYFRQMRPQ